MNIDSGKMQKLSTVWIGALICCALWGSAFPCIKIGYRLFGISAGDTASQILFAGLRFTLAGILVLLFDGLARRRPVLPGKGSAGPVLALAMTQTFVQYLFFYIGMAHTSGVKGSILESVNVFFSILVSGGIFHMEKLTARKWLGCLAGFAGVVLVNMSGLDLGFSLMGDGFMVISTIAAAFSAVFMKKFSQTRDPVILSGWQFITGGAALALAGGLMGGHMRPAGPAGALLLLYMAFISAAAYTIWGMLLKYNPVSRVTVFGFMNPVFGVILSALLLGEGSQASGPVTVLSLILVCLGIYIVNRPEGVPETGRMGGKV